MALLLNGKKIPRRDSFSLVEVAMAIAIVSFACVTLLGLLPLGLLSFRQAMNNTVESEIVQNTINDVALTSFSKLSTLTTTPSYYNSDGIKTNAANGFYTASVTFTDLSSNNTNSASPLYGITNYAGTTAVIKIVKPTQHYTNSYTFVVGNDQADTNSTSAATWH